MSRRTIRPPGPDPRTWPSSTCDDCGQLPRQRTGLEPPPSRRLALAPLPDSAAWLAVAASPAARLRPPPRPARGCGRGPWRRPPRPSPGRQPSRLDDLLGVLALLGQDHHPLAQRDLVAGGMVDVHDRAVVVRLHRHRGLVGLDVGQRVPFLDLVPDLDQPLGDHAGLHRGAELRHRDFDRHVGSPWTSPRIRQSARGSSRRPSVVVDSSTSR